MKKIVYSLSALMVCMSILFVACDKKDSDDDNNTTTTTSTTATTATTSTTSTTSTGPGPAAPQSLLFGQLNFQDLISYCTTGQGNMFSVMASLNNAKVTFYFYGSPTTTKTYNVVIPNPSDANSVQISCEPEAGQKWIANGGTAQITINPDNTITCECVNLTFVRAGQPNTQGSAKISCD